MHSFWWFSETATHREQRSDYDAICFTRNSFTFIRFVSSKLRALFQISCWCGVACRGWYHLFWRKCRKQFVSDCAHDQRGCFIPCSGIPESKRFSSLAHSILTSNFSLPILTCQWCLRYGLTVCAERSTLFHAVSNGARSFQAIVVTTDISESFVYPCGKCDTFSEIH